MIRLFLGFTRMEIKAASMYRQEFFLRILNNLIGMYGAYWLWNTLYTRQPELFTVSRGEMLTYGMLAMLMNDFFFATNLVRYTIMDQVRTGAIQMDLLRPLDYLFHNLARNVGQMGFALLTLGLPGFLAGALLLGLHAPASPRNAALFLLSLAPAYLSAFALNFLIGMVAIYTLSIRRIGWAYSALTRFFSGQLVPLWFFPASLALVVNLLPFRAMIGIPLSIYIGRYTLPAALEALGVQALWAAGLLGLCRLTWNRARAHLIVQEVEVERLRLYFKLLGMAFKSLTQFRVDFVVGMLGVIAQNGANLLAIGVILGRFHDLAGWTVWQIVFLYGIWMVGNSLYSLLFLHLSFLENYILQGTFDGFLVRPLSPFLQLLGEEISINGIGDVIFGVSTLGLASFNLKLHFGLAQWIFLLGALICTVLIELGLTLAISSLAFWTGKSAALLYSVNQVNWSMTQQYPLEMFGRGFRIFVTCFVPVAFLNYYPARWLLGKTTPSDPYYFLSFMPPVAACALLAIGRWVWRRGLRQYTSTGS